MAKVHGHVLDGQGRPVAGAEVLLHPAPNDLSSMPGRVEGAPKHQARAVTNDAGEFSLKHTGRALGEMLALVARNADKTLAGEIVVKASGKPIEIRLAPAIELIGAVVDKDNKPVANASVQIMPSTPFRRMDSNPTGRTNSQGEYRIGGLVASKHYNLLIGAKGYSRDIVEVDESARPVSEPTTVPVEICTLHRADQSVSGVVVDGDGFPRNDTNLTVRGMHHSGGMPMGSGFGMGFSGSKGQFKIDGLCEGPVEIEARSLAGRSITKAVAGQTNLRLVHDGGGLLHVQVEGDRDCVVGARVTVQVHGEDEPRSASTNEAGFVDISLPVGSFEIIDVRRRWYKLATPLASVGSAKGRMTGKGANATIRMTMTHPLRGVLRDSDGKPVGGAKVHMLVANDGSSEHTRSNRDGEFMIPCPRDKEVEIFARHAGRNLLGFECVGIPVGPVEICMTPAVTMTGRVVDSAGEPIVAAGVHVMRRWENTIYGFGLYGRSDLQGRYRILACPRGSEFGLSAYADGYSGGSTVDLAADADGEVIQQPPFTLVPADKSVAGVVLDGTGAPVVGVRVDARGQFSSWGYAKTDNKGRFRIEGLCAGEVNVEARIDGQDVTVQAQAGQTDVRLSQENVHVDEF